MNMRNAKLAQLDNDGGARMTGRGPDEDDRLLADERRLWQQLFSSRIGVWTWDAGRDHALCSAGLSTLLGRPEIPPPETLEELLAIVAAGDRCQVSNAIGRALSDGRWRSLEFCTVPSAGLPRRFAAHGIVESRTGDNNARLMLLLADISDELQTRKSADDFARLLDAVMETVPAPLFYKDTQGRYLGCNAAFAALLGRTREDVLGKTMGDMMPPQLVDCLRTGELELLRGAGLRRYRQQARSPDGRQCAMLVHKTAYTNAAGDVAGIVGVLEDDSDLQRVRTARARLHRALEVLSCCNALLVHSEDVNTLVQAVCRTIVETGGYRMAWLGRQRDDGCKAVEPVAHHGNGEAFLKSVNISWADDALGGGTVGTAIRTRTTQVNQNFRTNPKVAPWREEAARFGYQSNIALPLVDGNRMHGVLAIYAAEPDAFDADEVKLLQELADNLSFGVSALRTRAERDRMAVEQVQYAARLRQSLVDSIQALASLVEQRDPYTAGHQRRVAALATALARELRLPEDRVEGLRLAAIIHDIGKIHVPAEILTRPGRLDPIQRELVKTHARIGHDIIKDIQFPWPIARIVEEHHEHIDGSGYPNGRTGDQLLAESKILVAADVVEAMTSHRPYRAALGVDAALREITLHRGTWYDPPTVDACVRLFQERRFVFEDTLAVSADGSAS